MRKNKKQNDPVIEIEELWQPNEEQKDNLAERIDWKTVIKRLLDPNYPSQKAHKAFVNLKDLVGMDRFAKKMMSPELVEQAAQLYTKISKHTIRKTHY